MEFSELEREQNKVSNNPGDNTIPTVTCLLFNLPELKFLDLLNGDIIICLVVLLLQGLEANFVICLGKSQVCKCSI